MRHEAESVSLYALIQWGLQEHTERQLAALPSPQEVDAVLGDTSDFCRRVLEAVQQLLRRQRSGKRRLLRAVRKTVVAAALLASLLFCTTMANASVRAAVVNTIIEWTEQAIGIQFEMAGESPVMLPENYGPHYIPAGFVFQQDLSWKDSGSFFYVYCSEDQKSTLSIEAKIAKNSGGYSMDNEHIDYEKVTCSGVTAYLGTFQEHDGYVMLWVKNGIENSIYIESRDITLPEVYQIAENIY